MPMRQSHVPTWNVTGFEGRSSQYAAARPNRRQRTVQWGGAGVTSIGQHCHIISLTGSSGQSGLCPILALNASDMTLGCGRSRCGRLVVVSRAFSGFDNKRNQRARREAQTGAKSGRCRAWEIVAIGFADDCVVGVNRIGGSSMA
jgi:hypothetical protein